MSVLKHRYKLLIATTDVSTSGCDTTEIQESNLGAISDIVMGVYRSEAILFKKILLKRCIVTRYAS